MTPSRRSRIHSPRCGPARARSRARSRASASAAGSGNPGSSTPTLKLKSEFADKFEIAISNDKLKTLAHASHTLDEMLNRAPNRHAPYVGESAFATKAGIHASAILKEPETYEHVRPDIVGNRRKVLVSD